LVKDDDGAGQMPTFHDLVFHPDFEAHQAAAGRRVVTLNEADEAWYGERAFVRNRRRRAAQYLMLGRTSGGRDITVVVLGTSISGTWVAYTAWDTKPGDV
jgi:hypothetical protein